MKKKQIYLVDDHPLMRDSLVSLLNAQSDLEACGGAENAAHAMREIPQMRPDLVIVDICLKDSSGLDLVKSLKARMPGLSFMVLSMHDENVYAERCIRAGAHGYVMKSEPARHIVETVRDILLGKTCVSPRMAAVFAERMLGRRKNVMDSLTGDFSDRELEVFDLLGRGMGTRQIAGSLNISMKTVQTYVWRIKKKLCLSSATELMREATLWHDQSVQSHAP